MDENEAPDSRASEKQTVIVWWVLWAGFQAGLFVNYLLLSNSQPRLPEHETSQWLFAFIPVGVSTVLRWAILPAKTTVAAAFPLFVAGLALAEVTLFLGLFVFPAHRQELFIASAVGVFQYIPFFVRRYFLRNDDVSLRS